MIRAGIIGASGYTGGELLRLLSTHPQVELKAATSRQFNSRPVSSVHPNLKGFCSLNFSSADEALNQELDLLFLCLPHSLSMKLAGKIPESTRIIDLGADFRLKNVQDFERHYGRHECPELLEKAVYGLPELHREEIRDAWLVANPGCIATSMILAINPVAETIRDSKTAIDVKIGSTAAGRAVSADGMHAERTGVVRPYFLGEHRHLAELKQETGVENAMFAAHAVDMSRGILSTIHSFPEELPSFIEVFNSFRKSYSNEPFVRIVARKSPPYNLPDVKTTRYSNFCEIGFSIDERTGSLTLFSAIDNMLKGSAGQAVQNMNIMFGLDEREGINFPGFMT